MREDTQSALSHSWEQGWRTVDGEVLERGERAPAQCRRRPRHREPAPSWKLAMAFSVQRHLRSLAIAAADLPSGRLVVRRSCRACICIPSIQGRPWRGRPVMGQPGRESGRREWRKRRKEAWKRESRRQSNSITKQAACVVCSFGLGEHQHCRPVEKRQTGVGILTGEK